MIPRTYFLPLIAVALLCIPATGQPGTNDTSRQVMRMFREPSRDYSTGPLWVWNDMMTDEQVRSSLRDLVSQGIKQVFIHPRPGLMTPYLSEEWFRLWRVALGEAKKLDVNVWIYDENSYPSGFAGGYVSDQMPESRGQGLKLFETNAVPQWKENILAVYRIDGSGSEEVTGKVKAAEKLPPGRYLVAFVTRAQDNQWHGGGPYVNLLTRGVTEKFLEITMESYRKEIGEHFGRRVPGVFTDEPRIWAVDGLPWSETMETDFRKRWGYELRANLPGLHKEIGDWRKLRHNYYQLLHELFVERWARPYHDFCAANKLEWTGHYWEHEWPRTLLVPDNMAMYAWHQRPGIDILMNEYEENTHAQFGNVRAVKELSSVANQLGKRRTLCESYGAAGWDLRFEDMKRIGDWLSVLGVNTINQHYSAITIRGGRKRDHPLSFSYHQPWWTEYRRQADYFARLSAALSHGEQINRVLVLEPTTTAWMYQENKEHLKKLGDSFFELLLTLEKAQIEYDLGCEDILAQHGRAELTLTSGVLLRVGQRLYDTVIVPPLTENLNGTTRQLLEKVSVTKIYGGPEPFRTDGKPTGPESDFNEALQAFRGERSNWMTEVAGRLQEQQRKTGFHIERSPSDEGILFHQRRILKDGELLFLVNTSSEKSSVGNFYSSFAGVEEWDPYTGKTKPYAFSKQKDGIACSFELPPCGSLLLFLSSKPTKAKPTPAVVRTHSVSGPITVTRTAPNVLTLDYLDVTTAGDTRTNFYAYQANQFTWRKNGMAGNPWESAVQFKDELVQKRFPDGSSVMASYRFTIRDAVPPNLQFVLERPDLYSITCNGQPVTWDREAWWLDKAFGRLSIASAARVGENILTITAAPFTIWHELEPAYVLGSFSLIPADEGFEIAPERPLRLEATAGWNAQGHPFYGDRVSYSGRFVLTKTKERYFVSLPSWHGSVAAVTVNGHRAGAIDAQPWTCDVTRWLKPGTNEVTVTVFGTLKNTLGPHHSNPPLGTAWPRSFHLAPHVGPPAGTHYSTVAYGLFQPFVLNEISQP